MLLQLLQLNWTCNKLTFLTFLWTFFKAPLISLDFNFSHVRYTCIFVVFHQESFRSCFMCLHVIFGSIKLHVHIFSFYSKVWWQLHFALKFFIIVHTFPNFVHLLYPNNFYTFPLHFVAKKLGTHFMSQHGVMNNPLKVPWP
jgi:hypothetical protein